MNQTINNGATTMERMLIYACSEADKHRDEALRWKQQCELLSQKCQHLQYSIEGWQQMAQIVMDDAAICQGKIKFNV
jgi:hypothetical protein